MTAEEIAANLDCLSMSSRRKWESLKNRSRVANDHTVAMGVWAAQEALRKGNVDPKKIDLIIYIGEEHKEYPLWTAAIKIQEEIGAYHAWGFDIAQRCGTTITGDEGREKHDGVRFFYRDCTSCWRISK